jgi:hypothetical protein
VRNQIYEYLLEDVSKDRRGILALAYGTEEKGPGYLALARMNKEIRREYRPLLLSRVRVCVPAESLDEYLAASYPHAANVQGFENTVSEYVGSIAVLVDGPETVTTFDFMPLLTLCTRAEFKVTFNSWQQQGIDTSQAKFINDLNSLLQSWLIHAK